MMTIKYGLQFFFLELTDNDGQNFLAGIVIRFLRHALTSQIKKNQQKIATELIKTATRSKLITFKTNKRIAKQSSKDEKSQI
jgi:hypothetical protein